MEGCPYYNVAAIEELAPAAVSTLSLELCRLDVKKAWKSWWAVITGCQHLRVVRCSHGGCGEDSWFLGPLGFGLSSLYLWLGEALGIGPTPGLGSQPLSCCTVISDSFFLTLQPAGAQIAQVQALGLAEAQPVAVVQSVPGTHPVPMYAYSIKDPSCREVSFLQSCLPS